MSDGEGTAGEVIKDVSPVLSAIPYVGPIVSMAASIGGGALEADAAKKQQQAGQAAQQAALSTPLQPLRPEYLAALHQQMLAAHSNMPGYEQNKELIAQQLADQIRHIRMASPSGNATLAALGAAMGEGNKSLLQLGAENSKYRGDQQEKATDYLWKTGDKMVDNEAVQRLLRQQGLTSAAQLLNSAMLNKNNAANLALGGVSAGANAIGRNLMLANAAGAKTGNTTTTDTNNSVSYGNQNLSLPWSGTPSPFVSNTTDPYYNADGSFKQSYLNYLNGVPGTQLQDYSTIGNSTATTGNFDNPFSAPAVTPSFYDNNVNSTSGIGVATVGQ